VVLPVPRASVVGRVDVDGVDFAAVGEQQSLEGVEVLSVDNGVERLVTAALELAGRDETRVDGIAELSDDDEVFDGGGRLIFGVVSSHERRPSFTVDGGDVDDVPHALVGGGRIVASRREYADFVAFADFAAG